VTGITGISGTAVRTGVGATIPRHAAESLCCLSILAKTLSGPSGDNVTGPTGTVWSWSFPVTVRPRLVSKERGAR